MVSTHFLMAVASTVSLVAVGVDPFGASCAHLPSLSVGILIIGFVMLKGKGIFSKTTAYLGLAAGIFGVVSIAGFFVSIIINAVLTTVWVLFVGYRLLRLGQK